ncbi:hypothetical protein QO001_003900 [Methylobacterium brachiatum]|uniref:TniQ domain-containing protein n=1 Tax=Methylobacterium brachiatum TaxID=269660 RepID=A0AAJ1WX32_9HYPH|nr:TniQ family protein [Methylobacterium brachiatum]MCB4803707.1 TniQ family protein [Methylobacterium brachiatum]MDQ0544962.1 hypothetical protein [Methylobacterium brachiatum]
MSVLWPHLPFQPGETPASFMGRLAMRHGIDDPKLLGQMLGIDFRAVAQGEPRHLKALARVADVDASGLVERAIRFDRQRGGTYRGEKLAASALHRGYRRVCPRCLIEDAEASGLPASWAAYGRTLWMFAAIRTCPVHRLPLVEVGLPAERSVVHEFTRCIAPALRDLEHLAASHGSRPLSDLETYLLRRLDALSGQVPWLDSLDWHVAAKLCEIVGLVSLDGRRAKIRGCPESRWQAAGHAGFAIVSAGPDGLHAFIDDLYRTYRPHTSALAHGRKLFGTFYEWLTSAGRRSDFEPVRILVRRSIAQIMPLGAGDKILGSTIEVRTLHSIRTLSIATGRDPRRLRKILFAVGLAAAEQHEDWDHHIVFDAATAERVIAKYSDALTLPDIATLLGCSLVQAKRLAAAGFIRPIPLFANAPGLAPVYARAGIVAFRDAILNHAVPVDTVHDHMCPLTDAARRANCAVKIIIQLVIGGELPTIHLDRRKAGYAALLVAPREIAAALAQPDEVDLLKLRQVEEILHVNGKVISRLIRARAMKAWSGVRPSTRRRVTLVARRDLDAFRGRYISASELARLNATSCRGVVSYLKKLGIEPEIRRARCGVSFYLRDVVLKPGVQERLARALCKRRGSQFGRANTPGPDPGFPATIEA